MIQKLTYIFIHSCYNKSLTLAIAKDFYDRQKSYERQQNDRQQNQHD